jgi:hypothetical protein
MINQRGAGAVFIFLMIGIVLCLVGVGYYAGSKKGAEQPENKAEQFSKEQPTDTKSSKPSVTKESIDLHNLPLGDKKISTSPKKGYIYSCRTQSEGGGAFNIGPWINQSIGTYDLTKKPTVDGSVVWSNSKISVTTNGATNIISGNGLPAHVSGVYPIQPTDDAYQYDRNPNSIKEQILSMNLPTDPVFLEVPECVGGEVGIMLTGVPIFNGFDAASRDAVAYEIQDSCGGHPQRSGLYHYHGVSNCLKDETSPNEHSSLVGYAFDGFGIYGVKGEKGIQLSTDSLDECHGHTHTINLGGTLKLTYHYHLTYDFPYSVGCFKAKKAVHGPLGGNEEMFPRNGDRNSMGL